MTDTDYLKRAEAALEDLMAQWAVRGAAATTPEARAEVLDAKLAITRGFAELAAVQRGVPLYAYPAAPRTEDQA